jgi:hypothetical protein
MNENLFYYMLLQLQLSLCYYKLIILAWQDLIPLIFLMSLFCFLHFGHMKLTNNHSLRFKPDLMFVSF